MAGSYTPWKQGDRRSLQGTPQHKIHASSTAVTMLRSINPATGSTLLEVREHTHDEVDQRLARAASASAAWRATPVHDRLQLLRRVADVLDARREEFATLMTSEMGKTLVSARAEVAKCATACRYYAEHGATFIAPDHRVDRGDERSSVRYDPLGTVLAIMPWNFPFWQVIRFAAPALAAGNTGVLKHASNVPRCAMALDNLFHDAGAPDGVFQSLLVGSSAVAGIIEDPRVHAVTLTGSEGAGRSVAATAGRALKKCVLELGGSDPFVVCESADLDRAADVGVTARILNNGQSCIAAKRFILVERIASQFLERFASRMQSLVVGDPMQAETDVGPLATASIRDEVSELVQASATAGARVLLGGAVPEGPGYYYPPTILTDIPSTAPAWGEEIFGPVALVFVVPDFRAAIALANATRFGLGASVWTRDEREAAEAMEQIEAGSVFVNGMVASDPAWPFGGVKASGYGRELGSWGLREFVNLKTARHFGSR